MNNYSHVINYVSKAEQTPDVNDPSIQAKLKVCSGLANLDSKKYKVAAQKFVETTFNLGDFNDVRAPSSFVTLLNVTRLLHHKMLLSTVVCAPCLPSIDQN